MSSGVERAPAALHDRFEAEVAAGRVTGIAYAAFDRDEILFAGGVGLADVHRGEPVTAATTFRVGSISKLMTTSLVLRLVERGLVDLDQPFNRYLPAHLAVRDASGAPATAPLRSVLSHSSGLGPGVRGIDLGNPLSSYLANNGRVGDLAGAVAGLRLRHEPGSRVVYSNPAFNVAGHVAALAAGRTFETAVRDEVLGPLGMAGSAFAFPRRGAGVATPYGRVVPPGVGARPADRVRLLATPMGGLATTVLDLSRFGRMVLGDGRLEGARLLDAGTVAAATSLVATNHAALEQGYGLGFKVRRWRGRTIVGHDGNMPGVATQLVLAPDDGVGVVVLTNGYSLAVPHTLADRCLEHLLALDDEPSRGPDDRAAAVALANRIQGVYRVVDGTPPGVIGMLGDVTTRVRVRALADGALRVEGNPGSHGGAWLRPEGATRHLRLGAEVEDRANALVVDGAGGVDLWLGHATHLRRRLRSDR